MPTESKFRVERYHDISTGHRVTGHEGKCRHLHGHNYRIHFICEADALDPLGRVIDFTVIKEKLCMWVEDNWDHKFLAWENDPLINVMGGLMHLHAGEDEWDMFCASIVYVPFNPTAENMAQNLVEFIGPKQLAGTGIRLVKVVIEETAKCFASYGEH